MMALHVKRILKLIQDSPHASKVKYTFETAPRSTIHGVIGYLFGVGYPVTMDPVDYRIIEIHLPPVVSAKREAQRIAKKYWGTK